MLQKRSTELGIPIHTLKVREDLIIDVMTAWQVDLVMLAGWMRIVSPELIEAFPNRIINLHPSLLPKYKGLHAIEQAFESGDKVTGCTVHYVNEHLDSGEIILQEVPILANDTVETLTKGCTKKRILLVTTSDSSF